MLSRNVPEKEKNINFLTNNMWYRNLLTTFDFFYAFIAIAYNTKIFALAFLVSFAFTCNTKSFAIVCVFILLLLIGVPVTGKSFFANVSSYPEGMWQGSELLI